MKNAIRIFLCGLVFSALFLSSCSFGFVPSWKEKEKAIFSLQFATLDSIVRSNDGSRAIIQGDGFLYIRTLGGPKSDKGPLYGPYKVSSGSAFETNDIPAGNYSEGIAVIYSAIELGSFESLLKLPEDQFMSDADATAFIDTFSGIISIGISEPKIIKAGQKNTLSLTLVPVVNAESIINMGYVNEYTVTPATTDELVRKFIMLDNVTAGESEDDPIKDLVCIASGPGTLSRLVLYDVNGALVPNLTINTETRTYTVPYTTGTTFYLYIECTGGVVNLAFSSIYTSGATSERSEVTVPVTISGATAEMGKTLYFQLIPTFSTYTSYAQGSIVIQSDGTGSGQTISMITGLPITLETGTYDVLAYIDINGNAVSGLDGMDLGEPMYILDGMEITETQTEIALTRAFFITYSTFIGDVYYVSNVPNGLDDGSSLANSTTLSNAIALETAYGDVDGPMNWIVLTEDIVITDSATINIPTDYKAITLTSSGSSPYAITLGVDVPTSFLNVVDGAVLTIENVTISGDSVNGYYAGGGLINVPDGGILIMSDGATLRSNNTGSGPAVRVDSGSFVMEGGSITECFTSGGTGGGVLVMNDGTFTMSGGSISNCTASGGSGGGVYVTGPLSSFTMSGGTITLCDTNQSGGGVYVDSGYMNFGPDAQIVSNKAVMSGGGLYLGSLLSGFTLDNVGGTPSISGNRIESTSDIDGTGVYIHPSATGATTIRTSLTPYVSGNFSDDGAYPTDYDINP